MAQPSWAPKRKKGESAASYKKRFYSAQRVHAEETGDQATVDKIYKKAGKKSHSVDAEKFNRPIEKAGNVARDLAEFELGRGALGAAGKIGEAGKFFSAGRKAQKALSGGKVGMKVLKGSRVQSASGEAQPAAGKARASLGAGRRALSGGKSGEQKALTGGKEAPRPKSDEAIPMGGRTPKGKTNKPIYRDAPLSQRKQLGGKAGKIPTIDGSLKKVKNG